MNRKVIAGLTALMLLPAMLIACVRLPGDNMGQTQDTTEDAQVETTLGISQGGGVIPELPQHPTDATVSTEGEPSAPEAPTQPPETVPVPSESTIPPTTGTPAPEIPTTQPTTPEVTTPPTTTEPTQPEDITAPEETTVPEETEPSMAPEAELAHAYEQFLAMSGAERQAFQESFPSLPDFFAWLSEARAAYEEEQAKRPTYDGSVDLGDLIGGKS